MNETDRYQCEILLIRLINMIQAAYYQRQRGIIGDEIWQAWDQAWIGFLKKNLAIRQMYEFNVSVFSTEFVEYCERCKEFGEKGEGGNATLITKGKDA